jgi:hypothetical protein
MSLSDKKLVCRCNRKLRIFTDKGISEFQMQEVHSLKEKWYKEFLVNNRCDERDKYFQKYRKGIEEFASKCRCYDLKGPKLLFRVDENV